MRLLGRALVREVPGLQRVRLARRGGAGRRQAGDQAGPATRRRQRGGGTPHPHRRARARSRSRRRSRPRQPRARRRRAGGRQVDAASDRPRSDLRRRPPSPPRYGRGIHRPGEAACRPPRRHPRRRDPRGDGARRRLRDARARAPGGLRDRLDPDALLERDGLGPRLGRPGPRGRRPPPACREGARNRHDPRRSRDEGRRSRRAARARASRRLRASVRGGRLPRAPRPAGGQEPLRLDERDRRLRDDRAGTRRGTRSFRALRQNRAGRDRRRGRLRARGHAADPARDPGPRRARPTSRCRVVSPPASTPSGWR